MRIVIVFCTMIILNAINPQLFPIRCPVDTDAFILLMLALLIAFALDALDVILVIKRLNK